MNINNNRKSQKLQKSDQILTNDKTTSKNYSNSGKIKEKFIMFNNEKSTQRENKIKELEIIIKNTKIENKIPKIPKSNGNSKLNSIRKSKKTPNKEPYLKPKFCVKNKNSFSIKHKNKNLNKNKNSSNNVNDEINNIYLNFFKVYYDENGKKIKIIKNKSNYKKNKSKELVLTQKSNNKNIRSNTNIINYNTNSFNNNSNNYINKKIIDSNKIKKNYTNELSDSILPKKKDSNKNNMIEIKYFYPDTPSQSTATDNKSNAKSGTALTNKDDNMDNAINPVSSFNTINKEFSLNEKNNIIRDNIHYDNLPLFLKKRKILEKNDKKYKKKNIDRKILLNKTDKISLKESVKKLNTELSQGLLKTKFNENRFTVNHKNNINNNNSNEKGVNINLNSYNKNILKNDINLDNRINYFHNDISNLTLNMTFEQNNITNTINSNQDSQIKNIYISSFKKRNMKKELHKLNPLCLNNKLDNIEGRTRNIRHSIGLRGNYILFNYYRDKNANSSILGCQNMKNYNSNLDSRNNSLHDDSNLSYTKKNIIRYKSSNYFNTNAFMNSLNENEISILNKTKEILKINDDENNILLSDIDNNQNDNEINNNRKTTALNNSHNYLNYFQNSFFEPHKNNYNEKIINIPNIEYYSNAKTINELSHQNIGSIGGNYSQFSKIKRPCSLYINKKMGENERMSKRNFTLSDYYNNAIDRDTHLNMNLNDNVNNFSNIYDNNRNRNRNYQYKKISKNNISNYRDELNQKKFVTDNNNKTLNNNINNRFININQNDASQQLINRKINHIFKFNRNKYFIKHSANSSLNFIPSTLLMNNNNIINGE